MKNNLVVKHNKIIEASYSLSIAEQRLLFACISRLDSRGDFDIKTGYTITVEQSQDLFYTEKDAKNAYRDLREAAEKLYRQELKLKEDNRYSLLTRWVSSVKFDKEELSATLYFHEQIKPYLSNLKRHFTEYRLKHICQLTNKYSARIYELIVCWYGQNQPYKEITIDEFKELLLLGLKYRQFSEFKRYVITPVQEQINEFTDFNLEISFRKRGRSFHWIQLRFNKKAEYALAEEARSRKSKHNLTASEQKTRAMNKQRQKQAFEEFSKHLIIAPGMQFLNKETGMLYLVDENNSVMTNDLPDINRYFLAEEHIKQLLFLGKFEQVTNSGDTETKPLF